jgi:hypothetical protein
MQQADVVDDRLVQGWLSDLKDGAPSAKVVARRGLAHVFEARGMLEEATDLLTANLVAGAADPETLRWLARLYAALGDDERSRRAAEEATRILAARHPTREPSGSKIAAILRDPRLPFRIALVLVAAGSGGTVGWIISLLLGVAAR